jgi:putative nucleotidyltransferase with HDIG domain
MPHIAAQVVQKLAKPDSTPQEIHELLSQDQSLAARVLKMANSPFYGASRRVSSIKEAVIFMGFDTIGSFIMSSVMKDMTATAGEAGRSLWEHSICCAAGARHLGRILGHQRLEVIFLAGLMHDIGKSVLFLQVPEMMQEVVLAVNGGKSFPEAESELLALTHAEVGQLLAQNWQFPLAMVDVVANHHAPERAATARELTHTVSIANSLCHKLGIGLTKRPEIDPYALPSSKALGIYDKAIAETLTIIDDAASGKNTDAS